MNKFFLETPAILLDKKTLKKNIEKYQRMCDNENKELWPMLKTHKSSEILKLQIEAGANGVLCGTLEEAEQCAKLGVKNIMYAYPVASTQNIKRVIELSKRSNFIIRIDDLDGAMLLDKMAKEENVIINYTIIVDSGLHRFGVSLDNLLKFTKEMEKFSNLNLKGISTHPGHVYGANSAKEVAKYVEDECNFLKQAKQILVDAGYDIDMITSGSTPTFNDAVKDKNINILHPGNYVFNDVIQIALGAAKEDECALRIYATIISHPRENLYICDAGAKCLGLDKGAHGNTSIIGYGRVVGHPEAIVYSLSEEVGKIEIKGATNLKVGDKIEIIPNHSCSSANLTGYYTIVDNDEVVESVEVDIRGNSKKRF